MVCATGFQPVRADSASRLSAKEPTGWKPVGQDRRDGSAELAERAGPPARLAVLGAVVEEGGAFPVNIRGCFQMRTLCQGKTKLTIAADNRG